MVTDRRILGKNTFRMQLNNPSLNYPKGLEVLIVPTPADSASVIRTNSSSLYEKRD